MAWHDLEPDKNASENDLQIQQLAPRSLARYGLMMRSIEAA
jgi:hypothetical protein